MRYILLILTAFALGVTTLQAYPNQEALKRAKDTKLQIREQCAPSTDKVELRVNNVRAMLQNGGDVWWDRTDARYIVPNVSGVGAKPVSSIFSASVWIGGKDEAGNLKFAGKTYGGINSNDFWPGPLNDETGQTTAEECRNWDRFFSVSREEVDEHKKRFKQFIDEGIPYDEASIPAGVLNWPAKGNPFFTKYNKWPLPSTTANLAPYWDNPNYGDVGSYNPLDGDYPIIEVRGIGGKCYDDVEYQANPAVADQMVFWIYNDQGGGAPHSETGGTPIQMEIQVEAFAFATGDALNDMTFMRYKLVNRAPVPIQDCYFGWWVDADLGCPYDDFIGCDTTRSLVYYYNSDDQDGNNGTICTSGGSVINTYKDHIPIVGIDYFEGPTKPVEGGGEDIDIGMTAFMYYNNGAGDGTGDPQSGKPEQWYNLIQAKWAAGNHLTVGGTGFQNLGGIPTNYAFPSDPGDATGWSMCSVPGLPEYDRRSIQSTGPIRLDPNKTNFLVVGVPWVPDQDYPCPPLDDLRRADDICQSLFDNCFKIFDGPDAPNMDIIELDRKLIIALSYEPSQNNYNLDFSGFNPGYSPSNTDSTYFYKFEGYQIYQLVDPSAVSQLDDPSKARLVAQVDKKNNVSKLYNWVESNYTIPGTNRPLLTPVLKVTGENKGLKNVFEVTEDQFSTGADKKLVNHKEYYYVVVAYATNNFKDFNPYETSNDALLQGQKLTFVRGRRNIQVDGAVPRPINDRYLHANVGDGSIITRLDGQGNYKVFLDMADTERDRIINARINGEPVCDVTYLEGAGPVQVKVYNPLDVQDGKFVLTFSDDNMADGKLDVPTTKWTLTDQSGKVLVENEKFDIFNEKLIADYGFSIFFNNNEPGDDQDNVNGYIGETITTRDKSAAPWLAFQPDQDNFQGLDFLNYMRPSSVITDIKLDSMNAYEKLPIVPFQLALRYSADVSGQWNMTPAPVNDEIKKFVDNRSSLKSLNNVDIVFTSNRDLWSRCVVVESSNNDYIAAGLDPDKGDGIRIPTTFDLRQGKSISKDVDADGKPIQESTVGFSWFPGYAIDVETGERLNIFFAENSSYKPAVFADYLTAAGLNPNVNEDMIWNPSPVTVLEGYPGLAALYFGGQHYIYVTDTKYDECKVIQSRLKTGSSIAKGQVAAMVKWVGFPLPVQNLLSYKDGLIPAETVVKIRVNNAYQTYDPACENQGMPKYNIELKGKTAGVTDDSLTNAALDMINVVPNPYYAYSSYEKNEIADVVKITNLPAKCEVNIYSLDGKFIRHFSRNETPEARNEPGAILKFSQIYPDLEWDLKNSKGITVASGIYLIHIKSDKGERVIKWVGAIRQLEISGF